MKYIIQIHTGSLRKQDYSVNEIINKLEYIINKIQVSMVIFGWYQDIEYNKILCNYLKSKHILSIFKLPIFSEITDLSIEDPFIYYNKYNNKQINNFYKNDTFDFVCPNSINNLNYIMNIFDNIDNEVNFDGVFFDRIRYQAWGVNNNAIFGCNCDNCKKLYNNIDINNINNFKIINKVDTHYEYLDSSLNYIIKIKRDVITSQVKRLYEHYKPKNKIIGIDTFCLTLADLVGQDIKSIADYVDFIKPMNYYKTFAPAGIPYEYNCLPDELKQSLSSMWQEDILCINSSIEQTKELLKLNKRLTIGIDANYVKDICDTNIEYIKEHIKLLENIGIEEVVLSWNTMIIDNEIIDKLQ